MTEEPEISLAETLDVLNSRGDGVVTLSDGKVVTVRKCTVAASGVVIEFLHTALDDVLHMQEVIKASKETEDDLSLEGMLSDKNKQTIELFLQLIAKYVDKLAPMVSKLSTLSEEEFNDTTIDDAIILLYSVWVVNKRFFSEKVVKILALIQKERAASQK